MRLEGKTALITGAGSGMGRLAAEVFAREGASVLATDISADALQETVERVRGQGGEITGQAGDVRSAQDVRGWVERAVATYGQLDVLYNNAGIFPDEDGSVTEMDEEVYQRVIDVNLKGVSLCCKYGVPEMVRAGGGSIVNVASFVALVGCTVPQDAYTASKGAVLALTRSLAVQFGPQHVRVNAICPGPIETPLLRELLRDEEARNRRLSRIPLGRFGRPEDIVNAALYLASDEASWTTGTTFVVDGGISVNYF
ncbi:MAG: glucose 1-dehydrogenase [Chloroflexi bacterium]|nr:glucose 1-dehydrogenase [Chloroflexota bacterium]